jgi:uncharacterized protein (TIGR00255 family)
MAIKSMTGFGEGTASVGGISVVVELSSVNRKQLDININLPRNHAALDALVTERMRREFSRGRISGSVRIESTEGTTTTVQIDEALAAQYIDAIRQTAQKLKLEDDLGAESLTRLPGLISTEQESLDPNQVSNVLEKALEKALRGLSRMRAVEGKALEKDLRERLTLLEELMNSIREDAPNVVKDYRKKLFQRLEEAGLDDLASDERIVKEVALFADRCDISEELTRLKSHLTQARKLLRSTEPVGRTLDFLCQELFREINTVGSKANEAKITRQVVAFKTELERIREQVQNIE